MFIGQYEHSLEEKGRLSIPKKFRDDLTGGGVLTRGLDGCLFLFARERWEAFMAKVSQVPLTKADARGFARHLTYGAVEVEIDRQGRILIPEFLREFAGIKSEIVVAGALERVEIWSKEKFDLYQEKLEKESEPMAERLADLGII